MADHQLHGEDSKYLQAKLDGLDIATLQQLLQTAIANKIEESNQQHNVTPVTPSSTGTPVEVDQSTSNEHVGNIEQFEQTVGDEIPNDKESITSSNVLASNLQTQQIQDLETEPNHSKQDPATEMPNHTAEMTNQAAHQTSDPPNQASPIFISLDNGGSDFNHPEHGVKPSISAESEKNIVKHDNGLQTDLLNPPSKQPSTGVAQQNQTGHDFKPTSIPVEREYPTTEHKSLPADKFCTPSNAFDKSDPIFLNPVLVKENYNQPDHSLPSVQLNTQVTRELPSTTSDQNGHSNPLFVEEHIYRPDESLRFDQSSSSNQSSATLHQEEHDPKFNPISVEERMKLSSKSIGNQQAPFSSILVSSHTDQPDISPDNFPSVVPPVFIPLSKVGQYLPNLPVMRNGEARVPLKLKPVIVIKYQVAVMVFESDDGTCQNSEKLAQQYEGSSLNVNHSEERQPLDNGEEQQVTQHATFLNHQLSLQDEYFKYDSRSFQQQGSPYNEVCEVGEDGRVYLKGDALYQKQSQLLPQEQVQKDLQGRQQIHQDKQKQQPQQDQQTSQLTMQPQLLQTQQQQSTQQQTTQAQQHEQPYAHQSQQQQQQSVSPQLNLYQQQPGQQQHLNQQSQEQNLSSESYQQHEHEQTQQYSGQQQQYLNQQYQQQNFSPQLRQPITSFPAYQDPPQSQQVQRSSSLPHLPTGSQPPAQQVVGQNKQPQSNYLPGSRAPTWMSDEHCKSCCNCGRLFSITRRKHHCRSCGKIFCNECCNQLAQLPYLGKQIARICVACTQSIRKAQSDRAKRKQAEKLRRYSQSSVISQPSFATNHSLLYIPNNNTSESSTPRMSHAPSIPENNFDIPRRTSEAYQKSVMPDGNFNPDIMQSIPDVPLQSSSSQGENLSFNDRIAVGTRSERSRGFSHASDRVGNSWKIPPRAAGRTITWTDESKTNLDERQKRFKNLNKVLKSPEGAVIQAATNLSIYVKKTSVVLKQALHETWFMCSHGFSSCGQREIAFLLEKQIVEDVFPYEMLKVFRTLYSLILNQGERFEHGNYLVFNNPLLGSEDNAGFLFISLDKAPKLIQHNATGKSLLFGILFKQSELPCARYLPTRLLNALGSQQQCFPSPAISSRDRPAVCTIEPNELFYSTFFSFNLFMNYKVPLATIPGVHILKSGNKVVLELPFTYQTEVINILDSLLVDESKPVTVPISGDLVPEASGHFVYSSSSMTSARRGFVVLQNSSEQAEPGNQYLAFSAILLVLTFGDACNSRTRFGIEVIEDGITITLSDSQAREVRQAIYQGTNCAMSVGNFADSKEQFTLRWTSDTCPSILDVPTPVRVVPNAKKSNKGYFPTSSVPESQPPTRSAAGQTNVIIDRVKTRDIEAAIKTKITSGDPQRAVIKLESDVKQACAGCLLTFANRLRSNAEKRLNLSLSLGPRNYKKWALGPNNQPINLARALQLALNEVDVPEVNDEIVFVFNVILQKKA